LLAIFNINNCYRIYKFSKRSFPNTSHSDYYYRIFKILESCYEMCISLWTVTIEINPMCIINMGPEMRECFIDTALIINNNLNKVLILCIMTPKYSECHCHPMIIISLYQNIFLALRGFKPPSNDLQTIF
jgi:hypothetical protein